MVVTCCLDEEPGDLQRTKQGERLASNLGEHRNFLGFPASYHKAAGRQGRQMAVLKSSCDSFRALRRCCFDFLTNMSGQNGSWLSSKRHWFGYQGDVTATWAKLQVVSGETKQKKQWHCCVFMLTTVLSPKMKPTNQIGWNQLIESQRHD